MPPKLPRFNNAVQKLYDQFFLIIFFLILLVGCEKKIDLSSTEPYAKAIGKSFVLQQDYYIFRFNDSNELIVGNQFGFPKEVSQKYIGCKFREATLIGIAKKSSIIKIKNIVEENVTLAGTFDYFYVSLQGSTEFNKLDAFDLVNIINNPPITKTWSDPPIFDPKAALPLPSDGIWWK